MQSTASTNTISQVNRENKDRRQVDLALIFVHGDGRRFNEDRRQRTVPVAVDRRTSVDRRTAEDRRGTSQTYRPARSLA
ncbi:MAG: hypothetical protein JSW54_09390 [Fidelibacterota bacterium]|nr:MAG: hypothetical protein JSW54_09390 [Candidatus Neomarinimicrobiota bacterium]